MGELEKKILIAALAFGVVTVACGGGSGQVDYPYGTYDDEGYYADEYENWQAEQAYEEYQQDLYDSYAEEALQDRYYDDLDRYDYSDGFDEYEDHGDYGGYSGSGGQSFGSSSEGGSGSSGCPNGCTVHAAGCEIKGNVSYETGERIYHVPGQEFYAQTVINPAYGERWFCTEAEAVANGWRRSMR